MGQFTNGSIKEDNNIFIFPKDLELANKDLLEFIDYHRQNMADKYRKKLDRYKGKAPENILKSQSLLKKNNLIVDMPKYLVDTLNGFFVGIPPTLKIDDKDKNAAFQEWSSST